MRSRSLRLFLLFSLLSSVCSVCCVPLPLRAQDVFITPPPPPNVQSPVMSFLEEHFAGEPVVAVSAGWGSGPEATLEFRNGEKLLSRLQDVAEAYSPSNFAYIPYAVRRAWVLAPETRQDVNLNFTNYTPMDVTGRGRLLTEIIAGLNKVQIEDLTSRDGLAAGDLPAIQQKRLARMLRVPFRISVWRGRPMDYNESFTEPAPPVTVTAPVDVRAVRLKIQLRSQVPSLVWKDPPESEYYNTSQMGEVVIPPRPILEAVSGEYGFFGGTEIPVLQNVPNTFKPADLDGKTLAKPIGIQGAKPLDEVLQQVGKVTGLKLAASNQYTEYRNVWVFVGAPSVACGEVTDGLRLALTASWRKLGDTYLLTWDKRGLGALQKIAQERTLDLAQASDKEGQEADESAAWLDVAALAPFAADDPFAWTSDQRAAFFAPRKENESARRFIAWDRMTASQQRAARALAQVREVGRPDPVNHEWHSSKLDDRDLRQLALTTDVFAEPSLFIPGQGWVFVGDSWQKSLNDGTLDYLRARLKEAASRNNPAPPMSMYRPRQPHMLIAARQRALMVPVMPPEQLMRVLRQMEARGFGVLYYPILAGGYATFPSKAFPPHPKMGSQNGWLSARKAAANYGITVYGYMEALAWRAPGATGHWLDAHRDWLDVDVLGRPLTEVALIEAKRLQAPPLDITGDLVRVSEPNVVSRLETLLSEFQKQPGSNGLLLDAWNLPTVLHSSVLDRFGRTIDSMSLLGCAVPDRIARLQSEGADPVDLQLRSGSTFSPNFLAVPNWWPNRASYRTSRAISAPMVPTLSGSPTGSMVPVSPPRPASPEDPYIDLAKRLLPKTRSDGQPWKTWIAFSQSQTSNYYLQPGAMPALPAGAIPLDSIVMNRMSVPAHPLGMLLRVPRRPTGATGYDAWPDSWPAIAVAEGRNNWYGPNHPSYDLVIYDFRGAPEEISDSLRRAGLPEDVPSSPTPPRPPNR